MDNAKVLQFVEHYNSLDEWEFLEVHGRRSSLTEEALVALDQVIAQRGIDLSRMQEVQAEEFERESTCAEEQRRQAEVRDSRYLRIFWVIAIPLTILGALFRPEHFLETLVSILTQAIILGLAYWGYLKLKRSRKHKSQAVNHE